MANTRPDDEFEVLWSNPMARRNLLRAAGIGLGAMVVAPVLAACTSAEPGAKGSGGATGGASGGVNGAMANTFLDLDPTTASQVGTAAINAFVYEALYRLDPFPPRTKVSPELATEIPRQITPTKYRIKLREGVTFHDGSALTADDVVFTIERIKDAKTKSLFARFFKPITGVRAVGDNEIEISLSVPTTLLPQRLALVRVMSKAAVGASPDSLKLKPIGTGPYQVSSAVSGREVVLKKFDKYSGPRQITVPKLQIDVTADANARVAALRSGKAGAIDDVPGSAYASLSRTKGIKTGAVPSGDSSILLFHCGKPPFDDARVRRAVLYAIDRDSITRSSFFGQAEPAWSGEVAPDHPDFVKPDTVYRYDPQEARRLLAEAGHGSDGIKIDFLVGDLDYLASQGPVIEKNLKDVGFVSNLIPGELESLYSRVTAGTYNMFLAKTDPSALGAADTEFVLRWGFTDALVDQFLYWKTPEAKQVAKLLDQAWAATDEAGRRKALGQVQNIIQQEAPRATLHHKKQLTAWSDKLAGFRPLPVTGFSFDGVK
jgi:peptide/nickel transport system substrate-binding protein